MTGCRIHSTGYFLTRPAQWKAARLASSIQANQRNRAERLANRQLNLLFCKKSAKIGAEIVYSTCTLAPEEDEMVVMRCSNVIQARSKSFHNLILLLPRVLAHSPVRNLRLPSNTPSVSGLFRLGQMASSQSNCSKQRQFPLTRACRQAVHLHQPDSPPYAKRG